MKNEVLVTRTERTLVESLVYVISFSLTLSTLLALCIMLLVNYATDFNTFAEICFWMTFLGSLTLLGMKSYNVIPIANEGVYLLFGKRRPRYSKEGWALTIPYFEKLVSVPVLDSVEECIKDDEIVTGDSVQMKVAVTIGYRINDSQQSLQIEGPELIEQLESFVKSFLRKEASVYDGKNKNDWRQFLIASKSLEEALKKAFEDEKPRATMAIARWGIEILTIKITSIVTTDPQMMKTAQAPAREKVEQEAEKIDTETLLGNANRLAFGDKWDEKNLVGISDKKIREAAEIQQRNRNNVAPTKSTSEVSIEWGGPSGGVPLGANPASPDPDPAVAVTRGVVAGNQINKAIENAEKGGKKK